MTDMRGATGTTDNGAADQKTNLPRLERNDGGRVLPLYTPPRGTIAVWSGKLMALPHLEALLGAKTRFRPRLPDSRHIGDVAALADWSHGRTAEKSRALAESRNLPFLGIDTGFLSSLSPRARQTPSCSLLVDGTGMHDDATRPSDLENLLNAEGWETPDLLAEARKAMDAIRRNGLSKYNHAPDAPPFLLTTPGKRLRVLLIDQPIDGPALARGMASPETFAHMLERAHADHPGAALFIKPHPEVLTGRRHGYLTALAASLGAVVLDRDIAPLSLLAQADEVYTVTSQLGFEALMLGKPVHCFGLPFYAGWGLTEDERRCPRRVRSRSVTEVFAAAYLLYSRYVNPVTGEPCSIHDAIRLLALQRAHNERNSGYAACLGFDFRNRSVAKAFLGSTRGSVHFFHSEARALKLAEQNKGHVLVRGPQQRVELERLCAERKIPLARLDDGFLLPDRANGLPPALIRDKEGMYDDPSRPSELENILQKLPLDRLRDPALLARAAALRKIIAQRGLTVPCDSCDRSTPAKQNDAQELPARLGIPPLDGEKKILLVPGEAEDSPSVLLGGMGIHSNLDLLRTVRIAHPDAYIVFAPRPDVDAGKRQGCISDGDARTYADTVARGVPLRQLCTLAHEVHTLVSPAGFEALLREMPVHTYGGPFYAGWGLTTDKHLFSRRTRPLTLDMLVAGALILCPTYYDWRSRQICGPEEVLRGNVDVENRGGDGGSIRRTILQWINRLLRS